MESIGEKELRRLRRVAIEAVMTGMSVIKEWRSSGRDIQAKNTGGEPGDEYVTAVDYAAETATVEGAAQGIIGTSSR